MPAGKLLKGATCLLEGLPLLLRPGIKRFIVLPLIVCMLVYALIVWAALSLFSYWVDSLMSFLPAWLSFLRYLFKPLLAILLTVLIALGFNLLVGLIMAPFNGLLAEKIEILLGGKDDFPPLTWHSVISSVQRELRKLAYFLPRFLVLFILSWVPLLNLIAAPLLILLSVWMMALQYLDYPAENHQLNWQQTLNWLRERRLQSLGFGAVVCCCAYLPFIGFLIVPAAVSGATVLWLREQGAYRKAI